MSIAPSSRCRSRSTRTRSRCRTSPRKTPSRQRLKRFASEVAAERRTENAKLADFAEQIGADADGGAPSAADLKAAAGRPTRSTFRPTATKLGKSGDVDEAYDKLLRQNIDGSFRVARPEVIKGEVAELVKFAQQQISDRTLELEQLEDIE